jgi:hypothetical protein
MIKPISFAFLLLSISSQIFAQKLDSSDSTLIKKYWDKIQISSVTSKSGNLYVNINNYLELMFPANEIVPFEVVLKTNNGSIQIHNNRFVTIPDFIGNSYIKIYIINKNNDTLLIGRKKFTVLGIPDPCLILGRTVIYEQSVISRKLLMGRDTLKLYFTDDLPESSQWYHIDYFNSGYTYGGAYIYEDNKGPVFSKKSLEVIKNQLPGQELVIKVVAVSPNAKHFRIMPIVRFKML